MSLTDPLYLSLFVPGTPGLRGPRGGPSAGNSGRPALRVRAPAASPGKAPPVPTARPLAEADAALDGPEGGRVVDRYAPQP